MNETITIADREYELPCLLGLPAAVHHALPAIGSSDLKRLVESPGAYKHGVPSFNYDSMAIGTALHTLLLEPGDAGELIMLDPWDQKESKEVHRNSAPYKSVKAAHEENTGGLGVMLKRSQYAAVLAMRRRIWTYKHTRDWWDRAWLVEHTIIWRDERTGVLCKARPDMMPATRAREWQTVVDVKTKKGAVDADAWRKQVFAMGYDLQAEHYTEGLRAIGRDMTPEEFLFLVVSTDAPHPVGLYALDAETIETARDVRRKALELYAACSAVDTWPCDHDPEVITPKHWDMTARTDGCARMARYLDELSPVDDETGEGVEW